MEKNQEVKIEEDKNVSLNINQIKKWMKILKT